VFWKKGTLARRKKETKRDNSGKNAITNNLESLEVVSLRKERGKTSVRRKSAEVGAGET